MEWYTSKKGKEYNLLCNEIASFYHMVALDQGLSDSGYEILKGIFILGEGCSQTDIYKNSYLNKQTVNSSVKQLVKKGLIIVKSIDRKKNGLYLTEEGEKLINERILPIDLIEQDVLEEMSDEEYSILIKLMKKYLDLYKKKYADYMKEEVD